MPIWRLKPTAFARRLRRESTDAERKLWRLLRSRQFAAVKFRRQFPIGRYIADFASVEKNLVIEVDGGQHANDLPHRTQALERAGYRVIRFWNNEVLENPEGVLHEIQRALIEP